MAENKFTPVRSKSIKKAHKVYERRLTHKIVRLAPQIYVMILI